jgi:hypothetical protein
MKVSKYVLWGGVSIIVAGLGYDIMYAGIPYQDAPADLLAEYNRNQRISNWIINAGLLIAAMGVLSMIAVWVGCRLMDRR